MLVVAVESEKEVEGVVAGGLDDAQHGLEALGVDGRPAEREAGLSQHAADEVREELRVGLHPTTIID